MRQATDFDAPFRLSAIHHGPPKTTRPEVPRPAPLLPTPHPPATQHCCNRHVLAIRGRFTCPRICGSITSSDKQSLTDFSLLSLLPAVQHPQFAMLHAVDCHRSGTAACAA